MADDSGRRAGGSSDALDANFAAALALADSPSSSSSTVEPRPRTGPPVASLTDHCVELIAMNFEQAFLARGAVDLACMPEPLVLYLAFKMFRLQRITSPRIALALLQSNHDAVRTLFQRLNIDLVPPPTFAGLGCRPAHKF